MPFLNLPTPTMGGKVFWETIKERNRWKLQQNMFTEHYRILSPDNIRRDWDTDYHAISRSFDVFTNHY